MHDLAETPLEGVEKNLTLEPMSVPDLGELAPDAVVIAVKAASVGWVDLLMTSGQYQHLPAPPYTPGLEYAGEVIAAGEGAGVDVGARVIVDGFSAGPRSWGAYQSAGGFATYAVVPASATIPVPGDLSYAQAASLLGSYETAWHCLVARGRLRAGETALILGASGSTGLAAVQIAKRLGATVIAAGRSAEKLEIVRGYGADHVVVGPLRDAVKALTGGRGVDVVYDGVGGETSLDALRCVRFGARFLVVGWASTPAVARGRGLRGAPNANHLPTNLILMKGLDVLGCPTAIATAADPACRAPRLADVLAWAAEGALRPHVSHELPLTSWREAMEAKWRGDVVGSCVLVP